MKKKFRLEDYQGVAVVMHCGTEEKAIIFCNFLHDNSKKWCTGVSYKNKTNWKEHKENTCYNFKADTYSCKKYFSKSHVILEFDDFDWSEEMKLEITTDYKDPKWCEVRDSEDEEWKTSILVADSSDLNLKFPYRAICISDKKDFLNGKKVDAVGYKYARPIPKKEYKPYDEPNFEWVKDGKRVIHRGKEHRISSVGVRNSGIWFVGLSYKDTYTTYLNMNQFLDECTWLDGSVCGEESKL